MVRATGVHKIHSTFSASGGVLSFTRDNASTQIAFGESASGMNLKIFGNTASAYTEWISASNELYVASGAKITSDGALNVGAVTVSGHLGVVSGAQINSVSVSGVATFTGDITLFDADLVLNTSVGTKIGTASLQKIGFFGVTPVVMQAYTATSAVVSTMAISILEGLKNLGLFAATG